MAKIQLSDPQKKLLQRFLDTGNIKSTNGFHYSTLLKIIINKGEYTAGHTSILNTLRDIYIQKQKK